MTQSLQTALQDTARVDVELGQRSYAIHIGEGLLRRTGEIVLPLLARKKTVIVTDENVAKLHLVTLQESLNASDIEHATVILPPGEATKSYEKFQFLCDQLLENDVERNDVIIAFGGGVIGDLAGFAAAVLRRGVNFVQIPTSLLAQVDSSVGGKTGINSHHGKNLVGAFHQPLAVIADISLLDTLPARELASGYAEIAKYGLLGDIGFFEWLEENAPALFAGDGQVRIKAISKSCEAKADIVARDEQEHGVRALLNLGHTFGHALEGATGYSQRLLHGEGVAIGTVLAFRFSEVSGLVEQGTAKRVQAHFASIGLPTTLAEIPGTLPDAETLVNYMRQDKKASGGKLVFVLANKIGETFVAKDVAESDILQFMRAELKNI